MGKLSNLPTEIILEILTRLPTESVLDCKLVCKPWSNLVSHHPSFSKMHLTHLNQSADSAGKFSFLVRAKNCQLHYFEYNESHDETPIYSIKRINLNHPFTSYYRVIGSVNGLVCFYVCKDNITYICNPVTREYAMLPQIKRDPDHQYIYWGSGFGYLPLTNEYKVVELYNLKAELNVMEVAVYTLGSGIGWRNVGKLDSIIHKYVEGVFMNGALYWKESLDAYNGVPHLGEKVGRLFSFDLAGEKFREHVLLPPAPPWAFDWYNRFIGDLGGVLYYAVIYYSEVTECFFDIWLLKNKEDILDMKRKVEQEPLGWSREFSHLDGEPLAITKNGGVLCYNSRSFGIYDPVVLTLKKIMDFTGLLRIHTHKTTLVSLKELGEEDTQIMEAADIVDTKSRDLMT